MNKTFVLILKFNLANWMLKELKAATIIQAYTGNVYFKHTLTSSLVGLGSFFIFKSEILRSSKCPGIFMKPAMFSKKKKI